LPSKPLRHGWRRYFSLAPQALYEAASAVSAPEGANATILVDEESYSFDESGRIQHVSHVIYKVLTQKGAEGWDYLSVSWEPWHEARPLIRARVIAPDFSVHELDPNTITEAPARGGDYKTYSDGKRLRAPFPAIAPGWSSRQSTRSARRSRFSLRGMWGESSLGRNEFPWNTAAQFSMRRPR
jgi:hypothetical protein